MSSLVERRTGRKLSPGFVLNVFLLTWLLDVCVFVVGEVPDAKATVNARTDEQPSEKRIEAQKGIRYAPCKACTRLVESFQKVRLAYQFASWSFGLNHAFRRLPPQGIERTARGRFEGGDTAWEEKKQGSYARSEVRLTEIQEDLCHDTPTAQHQVERFIVFTFLDSGSMLALNAQRFSC